MVRAFRAGMAFGLAVTLAGCGSGTTAGGGSGSTGAPQVSLSATSLAFGSQTVGSVSTAQTVTVTNTGSATLVFSSAIALSDSSNWGLSSTCGASLAPNVACAISVTFKPQNTSAYNGTVSFTTNAAPAAQSVALSGTGTAAVPQATLSPLSGIPFPITNAGVTALAQSATLTNSGNASLSITSIAIGGANASAFAQTNNCGSSLAAGSTCTISVTFTPAVAGASFNATLAVTDNAAGSPHTIALSGTSATASTAPAVTFSPTSVTFPATAVNQAAPAQGVTLTNTGNAALTGISISIGGGAASTAFSQANNCGATLAAGANCTISVGFTPFTTGTFQGTLSVADNAAGSPQTVSLSGTGAAPQLALSATSVTIPPTMINTTSSPYAVTLSNSGNAVLNISSIVLGGTNASSFGMSTTCGSTLVAGSSCSVSLTLTPATATGYSATVTITDNAAGSPQTINVSGSGTTSAVTHTLMVFPETDNSVTPLYTLINNAQTSIDMTMYALQDTTFTNDLVADCNRGVKVRVILDQNLEKSNNTSAFNKLNSTTNCSAVWANAAFQATHQKTITLDGTQTAIMSLNLQSQYYSTTRDFAMLTNDPADIVAIQATFNADYAAGTTSIGASGTSDFNYQPGVGTDLIWSPTTAQAAMTNIIANAKSTLILENEEMASSASYIISALTAACQRGVDVRIAMVNQSSYTSSFNTLKAAGCKLHLYPNTSIGFYVHAKAVVADYGLSTQSVYMGSINYSNASMTQNRELGVYITDAASVQTLYTTMTADYAGGTPY